MDSFEEFYIRAVKFLSIRPRSEKEVRDNLAKKDAPSDIAEQVIAKLTTQKFLNDTDFVRWWIRQRSMFRPRSFFLMKRELLQKGVAKDTIDDVFSESDEERVDELTMAKQIVTKHIGKYKNVEKREIYTKLGQRLARRGFSWDVTKRAIDDSLK